LPDANADYNLQGNTMGVIVNGWVAEPRSASLNGSDPVAALHLSHVFEGVLPHKTLMLQTLLSAEPMSDLLLATATYDIEVPPCRAAVRDAHVASVVALDGAPLRAAELSCLSSAARAAIDAARRAQLLAALHGCVTAAWGGGFLFLQRIGAALCVPEQRDALDALARAIITARDTDGDAATEPRAVSEEQPAPPTALPALPVATCAACARPMGAVRRVCSRCRAVCYHDADCQKQHWSVHRAGACVRACVRVGLCTFVQHVRLWPLTRHACAMLCARSAACHEAAKDVLFKKVLPAPQ
jgi:hypothetical protein